MKRETRPFVVEVRRGSKKQPAPFLPTPPESEDAEKTPLQRAEEMLFSREAPSPQSGPLRTGRILEPILEPPPAIVDQEVEDPAAQPVRRRGRPPGSRNRAALEDKSRGQRRGRPSNGPEVRQVALTPDVVYAAMETIAKIAPGARSEVGENRSAQKAGRERSAPPVEADAGAALWVSGQPEEATTKRAARARGAFARPAVSPLIATKFDVRRMFKPGERWKARSRLRALARRAKLRQSYPVSTVFNLKT